MAGVSYSGICPFCYTEHVEFRAALTWANGKNELRALFKCNFCSEGVIRGYSFEAGRSTTNILQLTGDHARYGIQLNDQWPSAQSTEAPPDCPANVANFYKQAIKTLASANFDASGMMFRKTLEAAAKALDPESKETSLAARIKALVKSHAITPALGAWATEIRLGGNDAAHEEDPFTKEEGDALHNFTENFLNYAFTMPAAVTRRSSPTQN